jgi:lysophospholipase L1-like esterase
MDGEQFDGLARRVARITQSRRSLFGVLAGSLSGAALSGRAGRRTGAGAAAAQPGQALEYFALGDSLAAGHGLMPTLNERDFDGTELPGTACLYRDVDGNGEPCCAPAPGDGSCCRRSSKAYPHKVAADLRRRFQLQVVPLTHHLACTGAKTEHLDSQVDLVLGRLENTIPIDRPVLVSITVGPNDFPWGDPDFGFNFLFWKSDQEFQAELDGRIAETKQLLKTEVLRLLDNHDADKHNPNVRVVLTEIHNPFHSKSVFFGAATLIRPYQLFVRTERAADALVRIYGEIAYEIYAERGDPIRVAVAKGIREDFKAHRSPRWERGARNYWNMGGGCGYDLPPGRSDTWVQYRDDPDSNSFPSGATNALENIEYPPPHVAADRDQYLIWRQRGGMLWRGDCFHPNDKGQQAFAHRVLLAANTLGFGDCAAGWLPCEGICRNAQTDPHHCGGCGNDCYGKLCRDGVCVCKDGLATCTGDDQCCSGTCFQLEGPPFRPARCASGCPPDQVVCNGACVALGTDANCAACGNVCASGQTCCGGTCVNLQTDPANCGACGTLCPAGTTCQGGACRCPEGKTLCGTACIDTNTDLSNCGGCGRYCRGGACQGGVCSCPIGEALCGTLCVNLQTNRNHCGSCGKACGTCRLTPPPSPVFGLQCIDGVCEECSPEPL